MNPSLPVAATGFVDIVENRFEGDPFIFVEYTPVVQYPPSPKTRMSFEEALVHLAASTKPRLSFLDPATTQHMDHIQTVIRSCKQFRQVCFMSQNVVTMSRPVLDLITEKSLESVNDIISVHFTREYGSGVGGLNIECQTYGFVCYIREAENILLVKLKEFLTAVENQNKVVEITLDDVEFQELFEALGWAYEEYEEQNLLNGAVTTIRITNDSNLYTLQYWNDDESDEESDSGISVWDD